MKDPEYNLLDEPWIPIRLLDGTITNVGLLELVERQVTLQTSRVNCQRRTLRYNA